MDENLTIRVDRSGHARGGSVQAERSGLEVRLEGGKEIVGTVGDREGAQESGTEKVEVWRDRALRLQPQMENDRKRQRKLAEEETMADRERLLWLFLMVADDLERALAAEDADVESLREGVDMTYQTLRRLIGQEGVEGVGSVGDLFDPMVHEAVAALAARAEPGRVARVVRQGYRLGSRLLRPARVIVAV